MSRATISTANEVAPERLSAFLETAFGTAKASFLRDHGDWLHRGARNRLVVLSDGDLAGYCAVIPTRCQCGPEVRSAFWWVDLWIHPRARGEGLQTLFDERIRDSAELKLGFPNEVAAKIHRKHGWGVRDDFRSMLFPLRPSGLRLVRGARGSKGQLLRAVASSVTPLARALALRLVHYRPRTARRLEAPSAEELSAIFQRTRDVDLATTLRDASYLSWRYFEAPHRDQLRFYVAGPDDRPDQALIARTHPVPGGRATRLLDVFGNLNDKLGLNDVLRLAVREAAREGAVQVTALSSHPALTAALRRAGLLISTPARFCWWSQQQALQSAIGKLQQHWVMGDSDNDEPIAPFEPGAPSAARSGGEHG